MKHVVAPSPLDIESLGVPITYRVDAKQYIAISTVMDEVSEFVTLALPE